jgi:hypothetical protein
MKLRYALPLLAVVAATGCDDFLTETPQDFFSPENFPASEADANLALGGIQTYHTRQDYYSRGWWFVAEIPSDHSRVTEANGARRDHDAFTVTSQNEWIRRVWQAAYGAINASNVLIQRVPEISTIPEPRRAQFVAAAKFWRALNYFNLARVYGEVPLHKAPVSSLDEARNATRAPLDSVYALIVSDLEEGCAVLPATWPEGQGKPTKGAACAALADAYLTMSGQPLNQNRWSDAARAAQAVMTMGTHRLRPSFRELWLIPNKTDPEFIFSIQFQNNDADGLVTTQSRPGGISTESGFDYWNTTEAFMNTFADGDLRKDASFLTEVVFNGVTYTYRPGVAGTTQWGSNVENRRPYWEKFWDDNRNVHTDRGRRTDANVPIYRYADVLLMFAEAENEARGPEGAYAAINEVRRRANLPILSGLSQGDFRTAVRQERSYELAFENKRWFDLKRWGTWLDVLRADPVAGARIQPHHRWAPLPQQELDNSPGLTQNPGY